MLRVAICDDDWNYCEKILNLLNNNFQGMIESIEEFSDGMELLNEIKSGNTFQIIFLDKEMSGLNGIEAAERIRKIPGQKEVIIFFITAYDSEVVSVVNVRPFAYIKKPIDTNIFIEKVKDAFDFLNVHEKFIVLEQKKGDIVINPVNIYYIESTGHHCYINYKEGKDEYSISAKLLFSNIQERCAMFVQVHKSFIINLKYLDRIKSDEIIMLNGDIIPIGRKYKKDALVRYRQYYLDGKYR